MTTTHVELQSVTEASVRAFVDDAVRRDWRRGVIAVQGRPSWSGPERLTHEEPDDVHVVVCTSTLAVREALLRRREVRWLVLITDRSDAELGPEVCAHLVWGRTRRPDPWEAVQRLFSATGLERRLVASPDNRDVAQGVAAVARSEARLPAVPSGTLTVEHLASSVCAVELGLGRAGRAPSPEELLRWSLAPGAAARWASFVATGGDALARTVRGWLAGELGAFGRAVDVVLSHGGPADLVPLGLVARCVAGEGAQTPRALFVRLAGADREHELDARGVLESWSEACEPVVRDLVATDRALANAVLARADELLRQSRATDHAEVSPLLRAALDSRTSRVAAALRRATADLDARLSGDVDGPLVATAALTELEATFGAFADHVLARNHPCYEACLQAVRLARWLSRSQPDVADLAAAAARHRDDDAWVDRAADAVVRGAGDGDLAVALAAVARASAARRRVHDRRFAGLLVTHTAHGLQAPAGTTHLEDVVAQRVKPLLQGGAAVLLLVADGMSLAVASEVVDDAVTSFQAWQECRPAGEGKRRHLGVAVLPTLTRYSRTSLLCGRLEEGEQRDERAGLAALVPGSQLHHKKSLDSSPAGYVLGDGVRDDIASDRPLVACVLNTVDDALDRSDPGGIVWDQDAVRHLRPLLDEARKAGRVVVLTADHGHVVERGDGRVLARRPFGSNRSRPVGDPPEDSEVRVHGGRVLSEGGEAVLLVDADFRYSAKKAGYHGGASPAEVLVPVVVLTSGPPPAGWVHAEPQAPRWWREPEPTVEADEPAVTAQAPLFAGAAASVVAPTPPEHPLVSALTRSPVWKRQTNRASSVPAERVMRLVQALLQAPGQRVTRDTAAAELQVPTSDFGFKGAFAAVERILNVEQYPVVRLTAEGAVVRLDEQLLREQFEVGA